MNCKSHQNMVVLRAFSKGVCDHCKKLFECSHTPCSKVCYECSEKYQLCTFCGESEKV